MGMLSIARKCCRIIRATVSTAIMVGASPTYMLLHTSWRILSFILPRRYFHIGDDFLWGSYQKLVVFFFEYSTGTEIFICGDIPTQKENCILICNHQCTMDWVVTDLVAIRQKMVGNLRYVFKDDIKYLPLYGYAFGVHGGVFVRRDGLYNERNMRKVLNGLMDSKVDMYFVVFPEGTRYSPKREELLKKSQAYAIENDLRPLVQVLTPRIKAFHCALTTMRQYIDAIYDVTIVYDEKDRPQQVGVRPPAPNMWTFLTSCSPQIFLRFDRVPVEQVPCFQQRSTFAWLHSRFERKESLIVRHFSITQEDEKETCIRGVVTSKSNSTIIDDVEDLKNGNVSTLPLSNTFLPVVFLTGTTAALWCHPIGRKVYIASLLGGSVFGMFYAKVFL